MPDTKPICLHSRCRNYNNGSLSEVSQRFAPNRSEEHTSELQSRFDLVCRLLLEKKKYSMLSRIFVNINYKSAIRRWTSAASFLCNHVRIKPISVAPHPQLIDNVLFFFFNDTATTEIYTLSLHDALPIAEPASDPPRPGRAPTKHRTRPVRARAPKALHLAQSPRRTTTEPASCPLALASGKGERPIRISPSNRRGWAQLP